MAKKRAKTKVKPKAKPKRPMMKASKAKAKPIRRAAGRKIAKPAAAAVMAPAQVQSKALAPGCNWVNPYLTVRDVGAAIQFYENAFGFKLRFTMPGPDGKIAHAEMMHNDSLVMMGPENPEMGSLAPQAMSPVTLYIYVENVDDVASRASAHGGKIVRPPRDEFWGDRCCILIDPQGHTWMVATHVKDVSPEEMHPPTM